MDSRELWRGLYLLYWTLSRFFFPTRCVLEKGKLLGVCISPVPSCQSRPKRTLHEGCCALLVVTDERFASCDAISTECYVIMYIRLVLRSRWITNLSFLSWVDIFCFVANRRMGVELAWRTCILTLAGITFFQLLQAKSSDLDVTSDSVTLTIRQEGAIHAKVLKTGKTDSVNHIVCTRRELRRIWDLLYLTCVRFG